MTKSKNKGVQKRKNISIKEPYRAKRDYKSSFLQEYLMTKARHYQKLAGDIEIYYGSAQKIPAPFFVTLYNGLEPQPERKEMKLSDFLREQKKEAQQMIIYDMTDEQIREVIRRAARREGLEQGRTEGYRDKMFIEYNL
jgi:hypothetical protein